jgi:peroxiredoxin
MKNTVKILSALIIMILPAIVLGQAVNFKVVVKVGQLPATAKAYLLYTDSAGLRIDSATMDAGRFTFSGTLQTSPVFAGLIIGKKGTGPYTFPRNAIGIYLEPGMVTVSSPDSLENAEVTGDAVNADNKRLTEALAPITAEMAALVKAYMANDPKQRPGQVLSVFSKSKDSLYNVQKQIYLIFIKANPNAMLSLFALRQYAGDFPDVSELEPVFNLLSDSVKATKLGMAFAANLTKLKATAIGAMAPDFTQPDTSGVNISLHDFRGKYVLVDFWASWCIPCRQENPNVVKAYNEFKDKGFTAISVSLDQPGKRSNWIKAIKKDQLTWTQVSDLKFWKNQVAQLYYIEAIPQNFLVGPDGKIVAKNLKGDELTKKLTELLKDK